MSKVIAYITAREGGMTDAEAAEEAGYKRGSPSSARDMYALFQILRDEKNAWGAGPRSVRAMIEGWKDEQEALREKVARERARINDIEHRLKMATLLLRSKDSDQTG